MRKVVHFGKHARQCIIRGIDKLEAAVRVTLGPEGKNVLIDSMTMYPRITKDGVTVAREFGLEKKEEDIGVRSLKEAASRTEDEAGDGTTTSIILAHSICKHSLKARDEGISLRSLKLGIEKGYNLLLEKIKEMAEPITSSEQVRQVATISANNDEEIGNIIERAISKIGDSGGILVEESKGMETSLEIVKGYSIDKGFLSPYFMTHPEQELCKLENPYVLLFKERLEMSAELVSVLEFVAEKGRSLLIISDNVSPEVMSLLVVNKMKIGLRICAITPPYHADRRWGVCEDLEVLSGAQMLDNSSKSEMTPAILGELEKAEIKRRTSSLIAKTDKKADTSKQVQSLKDKLNKESREHYRESLRERIAKLEGGLAIIKVGGHTEAEMMERKYRVTDAQLATFSALMEGVLPGGGLFFLLCLRDLGKLKSSLTEEEQIGMGILITAIQEPFKAIVENAGKDRVEDIFELLLDEPSHIGYNAKTGALEDMKKAGILDSAKVIRCALDNAVSVALTLLTTEAMIIYEDTEEIRKGLM